MAWLLNFIALQSGAKTLGMIDRWRAFTRLKDYRSCSMEQHHRRRAARDKRQHDAICQRVTGFNTFPLLP